MLKLKICLTVFCLLFSDAARALRYEAQTFSAGGQFWEITVPEGFRLEALAPMEAPRMIAVAGDGALIVGSLGRNIYRVPPPYDRAFVYAKFSDGGNHGVALRGEFLWVARSEGVYKIPYRAQNSAPYGPSDFTHIADLPVKNGGHFTRTIKTGPDGRIYVSLGISGNCSDEYLGANYEFEDRRGGVLRLIEDASSARQRWEIFASGLRNPVGFDWHPPSGIMYASNNGPDHLGYDRPPEYFSAVEPGSFHGMPWFWFDGEKMARDRCIKTDPPRSDPTLPILTFPARSAPMDVAFVPKGALGGNLDSSAAIALRGSWATKPYGGFFGDKSTRRPPEIVVAHFAGGRAQRKKSSMRGRKEHALPTSFRARSVLPLVKEFQKSVHGVEAGEAARSVLPLIKGFQNPSGDRLARPVGLAFAPDANLYFTSDGGAVEGLFRLSKKPKE